MLRHTASILLVFWASPLASYEDWLYILLSNGLSIDDIPVISTILKQNHKNVKIIYVEKLQQIVFGIVHLEMLIAFE